MLYPYVCYLPARNVNMVHIDTWVKMNSSTAPKKWVLLTSTSSLGGVRRPFPVIDIYVFHRDLCAQRSVDPPYEKLRASSRAGDWPTTRGGRWVGLRRNSLVGRLCKDDTSIRKNLIPREGQLEVLRLMIDTLKKIRRQLGVFLFFKRKLVVMKMKPPFLGRKKDQETLPEVAFFEI